jgi:hypothetical protein
MNVRFTSVGDEFLQPLFSHPKVYIRGCGIPDFFRVCMTMGFWGKIHIFQFLLRKIRQKHKKFAKKIMKFFENLIGKNLVAREKSSKFKKLLQIHKKKQNLIESSGIDSWKQPSLL